MNPPPSDDILVIEDDPDTRANMRDILELDNYRIELAGSAADALRREDWSRFCAIVLDRQLPDATADSLLPRLRKAAPDASIIIVTGYGDLDGAIEALRQGATDYILKPINPDALRASLGRVAEGRRLSAAKERSEAAFRLLVEAAEALIVIFGRDGKISYFNPRAERLTGYPASEIVGGDFYSLLFPEDTRERAAEAFVRALGGDPIHGFEGPIACRDDTKRWVVWNARILEHREEGGTAILAIGQDITELKRTQERAVQSERLAAIGEMVTGLAHESRNALQRSQACLEMLALKLADRPDALDLVARIQKAQDHLHHLYEDVRDYAAPILIDRRWSDLAEIWGEAWVYLQAGQRPGRSRLRAETGDLDLTVHVDPFRMGQVFRNILENALAASDGPAEILIRAEPIDLRMGPGILIGIRDNGPGIPPELREKIFDPFFTTKTRGTGLGLAIVKRIVEAHQGRIGLGESDPPGTEFLIILPRG